MRITGRAPGTVIWNRRSGYVCGKFPIPRHDQIVLVVHASSGISQIDLEYRMEMAGYFPEYYVVGGEMLLYLVATFDSESPESAIRCYQSLVVAGVPPMAIALLNRRLILQMEGGGNA